VSNTEEKSSHTSFLHESLYPQIAKPDKKVVGTLPTVTDPRLFRPATRLCGATVAITGLVRFPRTPFRVRGDRFPRHPPPSKLGEIGFSVVHPTTSLSPIHEPFSSLFYLRLSCASPVGFAHNDTEMLVDGLRNRPAALLVGVSGAMGEFDPYPTSFQLVFCDFQ